MELLRRFKTGDVEAFETLFRQFQADVYRWIVMIVRDRGIAEDLTIETFWRIHKARQHFDTEKSFAAWARRIATNLAIDHIRGRRVEEGLPNECPAAEQVDTVVTRALREKIDRAFRSLPPKLRLVATLAIVEEVPYDEIAQSLGMSAGAIRARVFRAIRRLRKQLKLMGVSK